MTPDKDSLSRETLPLVAALADSLDEHPQNLSMRFRHGIRVDSGCSLCRFRTGQQPTRE
jgi:hypothetical protein